ncbi:hypothetical protein D3C76_1373400 [compost metagenome]
MANPGTRRHDAEAAEGLLAPFQENIAFVVTLHLQTHVLFKRVVITEMVNRYGVVDNKIDGRKRVHFGGIATETFDGFTHGSQIDNSGYAGEVLH